MRILVTGASGFIGARIAEHLRDAGHQISCLLRSEASPKTKSLLGDQVKYLVGPLSQKEFLDFSCSDQDAIVHCAGHAGTWGPRDTYWSANVDLTKRLAQSASDRGVSKWIQLSSPSIYFEFKDLLDVREDYLPQKFSSFYAETKFEADRALFEGPYKFATIALRPRFVLGRGDQQIVPRMLRFLRTGFYPLVGDGKHRIDVTNVTNICRAVELCLAAPPEAWGETYNISNGNPISLNTLLAALQEHAKKKAHILHIPASLAFRAASGFELLEKLSGRYSSAWLHPVEVGVMNYSMTLNLEKAKKKLGYAPDPDFRHALAEYN